MDVFVYVSTGWDGMEFFEFFFDKITRFERGCERGEEKGGGGEKEK